MPRHGAAASGLAAGALRRGVFGVGVRVAGVFDYVGLMILPFLIGTGCTVCRLRDGKHQGGLRNLRGESNSSSGADVESEG